MNLKDILFTDTNITGYTDKNNQPILVGHLIKDDSGTIVRVFNVNGNYVVSDMEEPTSNAAYLGMWIQCSEWVEIVVQAGELDTAPVALAPFDGGRSRSVPVKPIKKGKRSY